MQTLAEWKLDGVEYRVCKGIGTKPLLETTKRTQGYVESRIDDIEPTLADAICKLAAKVLAIPETPAKPTPPKPAKPKVNKKFNKRA